MLFRSPNPYPRIHKGGNSIVIIITMEAEFGLEEVVIDSYPSVKGPKSIRHIVEKLGIEVMQDIDSVKMIQFMAGYGDGDNQNWVVCKKTNYLTGDSLRPWAISDDQNDLTLGHDSSSSKGYEAIKVFKHSRYILVMTKNSTTFTRFDLNTGHEISTAIHEDTTEDGGGTQHHDMTHTAIQHLDDHHVWYYSVDGLTRARYDGSDRVVVVAGQFEYHEHDFGVTGRVFDHIDGLCEHYFGYATAMRPVESKNLVFFTKRHDTINNNYVFRVVKINRQNLINNIYTKTGKLDGSLNNNMHSIESVSSGYIAIGQFLHKSISIGLLHRKSFKMIAFNNILVDNDIVCSSFKSFVMRVAGNDLVYLNVVARDNGVCHNMLAVKRDKFHELRIPCSSSLLDKRFNYSTTLNPPNSFIASSYKTTFPDRESKSTLFRPYHLYFRFE